MIKIRSLYNIMDATETSSARAMHLFNARRTKFLLLKKKERGEGKKITSNARVLISRLPAPNIYDVIHTRDTSARHTHTYTRHVPRPVRKKRRQRPPKHAIKPRSLGFFPRDAYCTRARRKILGHCRRWALCCKNCHRRDEQSRGNCCIVVIVREKACQHSFLGSSRIFARHL